MLISKMTYITSPLVGGLGNQLFIVAGAFNLSSIINKSQLILLDTDLVPENRPTYWKTFFADCPSVLKVLVKELPTANWQTAKDETYTSEFVDRSVEIEEARQNGFSTIYHSYFQNWRHLPIRERILELFNVRAKQERLGLKDKLHDTCAVHFRLGDYRKFADAHPLCTDAYYATALKQLPGVKKLLIFVEKAEEDEVARRLKAITSLEFEFAASFLPDYEELILMSLCPSIIMANSSFSWWGAYLSDASVVVYPKEWIGDANHKTADAFAQPGWIEISKDGTLTQTSPIVNKICIDVGSHDGADALRLLASYKQPVYAFEPHPRFYQVTRHNVGEKLEVLPYAVSDSTENFIRLNESQGEQSHSILPFKSTEELNIAWAGCYAVHPTGRSFLVRLTRLDAFLENRGFHPATLEITHLHVDAQGVDLEVLRSLGPYLRCVKTGVVEVAKTAATSSYQGQQGTIVSVRVFLEQNGFVVEAVKPNDVTEEISREFNIVFRQSA